MLEYNHWLSIFSCLTAPIHAVAHLYCRHVTSG